MKKLLALIVLLFAAATQSADALPLFGFGNSQPISGQMGGSGTTYVDVTVNQTDAATGNWQHIQDALNKGGHVVVDCNGAVYISQTLYVKSNTRLTITPASCAITGISGTGTLVANYASSLANVPWVTTQFQGSGNTGTTNSFSVIWAGNVAPWVASTAITTVTTATNPVYQSSSGNIYYLTNTTSCTTGSGTLTGTGNAIPDGTCTWNYVTTNQAYTGANQFMTATVYYPSHGLVVGNAVHLTPAPNTIGTTNWAASTAYLTGQTRISSSNYYVDLGTSANPNSCTSSTVAPSGTTNFTDGTCVWGYAGPTSAPQYVWTGAETGVNPGALVDSAFMGPFYVTAVNDTNYVTVSLRRQPATAFSGVPFYVKKADENITLDGGGTLNYNYPTNAAFGGVNSNVTSMTMNFSSVYNLNIDGIVGKKSQKYILDLAGISNCSIKNVNASVDGTNSDRIKGYGPLFDCTIDGSSGPGGDDIISFQSEDGASFNTYTQNVGDILNVTAKNFTSENGISATIYVNQPNLVMDAITLDHFVMKYGLASGARTPIAIYNGSNQVSTLGSLFVKNMPNTMAVNGLVQEYGSGGGIVQNLFLDGVEGNYALGQTNNTTGSAAILTLANVTNWTFNNIVVSNWRSQPCAKTNDGAFILGGGTVNNMVIEKGSAIACAGGQGYGVYLNGSTVNHLTIRDNYFYNTNAPIRAFTASDVIFERNYVAGSAAQQGVGVSVTGMKVHLNSNYCSNCSNGLMRINSGAFNTTAFSDGQNTLVSGSVGAVNLGSGTLYTYNFTDLGRGSVPVVSSCGAGSSIVGDNISGTLTIPTGTTTCTYTLTSNAYPFAPKGCNATIQGTTAGQTAACSVTWTNATTASFTITLSANASGTTTTYNFLNN